MNIYFLVEGQSTETQIYPEWLLHLVPNLKRVSYYDQVSDNCYYLFSSNGIPSIYDDIINAIEDISNSGLYDYLVICLDAEELTVEQRKNEIFSVLKDNKIILNGLNLEIIVQNRCFETWFLGNRKIFKQNPQFQDFIDLVKYYNVYNLDPELMQKPACYSKSIAEFHRKYLSEMLKERKLYYSKSNPKIIKEKYYLKELNKRVKICPSHLQSFQSFINFCNKINSIITNSNDIK
ncbi:MAG: hypothetical protein A2086_03205 [Spirochaetes bacterium GWD1_27_9]|nr:MAG: hypothetical protein A2Z98_12880 [Spirochaetes bacterium GWB1_27_13]OHD20690.1 MAG: hypothetical protein A2Y34_14155 [Spirochaetes bacterium GWC1_27_15]OHD38705.1 MAG: hypothetical protein A2086_03205 [Spirochaetes bacterium GWD1_27_9]